MPVLSNARITPRTGEINYLDNDPNQSANPDSNASAGAITKVYVETIQGENLGNGFGLFQSSTGTQDVVLKFKTLVAGSGVVLTSNNEEILIQNTGTNSFIGLSDGPGAIIANGILVGNSTATELNYINPPLSSNLFLSFNGSDFVWDSIPVSVGEINTGNNLGATGEGVYANKSGTILNFKKIKAGAGISLTSSSNDITITGSGEANSGSNIGTGVSIYAGKTGTVLNFKTLTFTGDLNSSFTPTDITINSDLTGENIGLTGTSIYSGKNSSKLQFKKLLSGGNLTISEVDDNVVLTVPPGEIAEMQNLGVGGAGTGQIYRDKISQTFNLRRLVAGTNISLSQTTEDIIINSTTGGGTVTSVNAVGSNGITVSGGPITTSGSLTIGLQTSGATAGSYANPTLTVNDRGIITSITSNPSSGEANTASNLGLTGTGTAQIFSNKVGVDLRFRRLVAGAGINLTQNSTDIQITNSTLGTVTSVDLVGNANISVTGTSPITTSGSFALDLTNTGVSAGTYTFPTVEVDLKGRIIAISSNSISSGTVTSVGLTSSNNKLSITNSPITNSGNINIDIEESNLDISNMTGTLSYLNGGTGLTTTTLGSLLIQSNSGYTSLSIGTQDQVLSVDSGNVIWKTLTTMNDPTTTIGDLIYRNNSNIIDRLPLGSNNQVLTVVSGNLQWANSTSGFADPMTNSGDIIIRDNTNTTTRLPIGSNNQVLTVIGGNLTWSNPNYTDPLTTSGDLLYRDSIQSTRLPIGTDGQVLSIVSGLPNWVNNPSGFSDPMTSIGDIIIRNSSNNTARLGVGTAGQILSVGVSGVPEWTNASSNIQNYSFRVNIDGSGNIDAATPFQNLPVGWSANRDNANQFTITHNLGNAVTPVLPLTGYALNISNGLVQKVVNGNPPAQYSCAYSPTANTFTVYGVTVSNTQVGASQYIIYKMSF